ncbi:hypothetical protein LOTGIDRAFT_239519 [Lottia gigantea]|uniref:EF-hand domain-containing protein n=1 Tax=Lottia gigantea TaxID=225164 RepID=V4BZ43_LOTGI|nr:hypothetical protein LOTGIDRAFT_239519 [Lottia gigantea]ESO94399.1 hypothetical protein LOTGIDRAFT_239519 [Lottia gigantea]
MKIGLILLVAVITMMCQEAELRKIKYKYKDGDTKIKIKIKDGKGWWGKRDADIDTANDIQEREVLSSRRYGVSRRWWGGWSRMWVKKRWSGKRDVRDVDFDNADGMQEREVLSPRSYGYSRRRWGGWKRWWLRKRWSGKKDVRDADFDAAYNAAAKDGVFTDEEIKSVFGVDENGFAEFKENFDVNEDGVVEVEEYETLASNENKVNETKEKRWK